MGDDAVITEGKAPPLATQMLERALGRDPGLAHLKPSLMPAKAGAAAGEEGAAGEDGDPNKGKPAAGEEGDPNKGKPAAGEEGDPNKGKPAAGEEGDPPAAGDEDDGDLEEIEDGDAPEVQLQKLVKAQKKTLKRIDKLTAERNELQRKLEEQAKQEPDAPGLSETPQLADVQDVAALEKRSTEISGWLKHLSKHAQTGMKTRDASGAEVEMEPEQVLEEILFWTAVQAEEVPKRRAFLEKRAKAQTEAAEKFKPWQDKKAFTEAKAAVEPGMKAARDLMEDYDLAVQERALGRLALSGEWELVPKRKQPVGGVESAPQRKAAPATPVNPPGGGGPPIKPAGTGPDLDTLKQKMLKNPGDRAAAAAYVAAVRASKQAA